MCEAAMPQLLWLKEPSQHLYMLSVERNDVVFNITLVTVQNVCQYRFCNVHSPSSSDMSHLLCILCS